MFGRMLIVLCLAFSTGFWVRGDDPLDRQAKEKQVKAAQLVAEAKGALEQARVFEQLNGKRKTRERFQKILSQLESADLPKDQQGIVTQVRQLVSRLDRELGIQQKSNTELVKTSVGQQASREAENFKLSQERTDKFVNKFIGETKTALATQKTMRDLQRSGVLDYLGDVDRLGTRPLKDERMSERYIWAMKNRFKDNLTDEERALLKALKDPIDIDWDKISLKEAFDYLRDKCKIEMNVNEASLKDVDITYEDRVSLKIKKVSLRSVLRTILYERGLSYILKDGVVNVVTAKEARASMVTMYYPISDFVSADPQFGPFIGQQLMVQNAQFIIRLIQNTVDPQIWQEGATIEFDPISRSLVVRAPAEMHVMLGKGRIKS